MHGLLTNAADFLVVGKDRALRELKLGNSVRVEETLNGDYFQFSLMIDHQTIIFVIVSAAYLLVANGFDVWLGNSRGSDYGLEHKTLDINGDEFWNFSFHEIGIYDLRTFIDFVLNETGTSKLYFVAHCQGATAFAALLSTHPEYNEKIIQAHLFAPAIFFNHFNHPLLTLVIRLYGDFSGIYRMDSIHLAFAGDETSISVMKIINRRLNEFFCGRNSLTNLWCRLRLNSIVGFNRNDREVDSRIFTDILNHLSNQASIKQFSHFAQIYLSGKFQQYDYHEENYKFYNSSNSPEYNLENVKIPVFLYSGGSDSLVNYKDVENLTKIWSNVVKLRYFENYNHFDFNHGKYSKTYFYLDIVEAMKESTT